MQLRTKLKIVIPNNFWSFDSAQQDKLRVSLSEVEDFYLRNFKFKIV